MKINLPPLLKVDGGDRPHNNLQSIEPSKTTMIVKKQHIICLLVVAVIAWHFLDYDILTVYNFNKAQLLEDKRRFEPFINRWQMRFNNKQDGYLFFKHIRKAGKASLSK